MGKWLARSLVLAVAALGMLTLGSSPTAAADAEPCMDGQCIDRCISSKDSCVHRCEAVCERGGDCEGCLSTCSSGFDRCASKCH